MSGTLESQLRELNARTEAEVARRPQEARELRAAALEEARELATNRPAELRLVNRQSLPPPGWTGMRRAERVER